MSHFMHPTQLTVDQPKIKRTQEYKRIQSVYVNLLKGKMDFF